MIITQASYFDLAKPSNRGDEREKLSHLRPWAPLQRLWPVRLAAVNTQLRHCRWAITGLHLIEMYFPDTLAQSYREKFGQPLPHPKMDAVADHLKLAFTTGEKALVFVRRVKSVSELTEKLNHHYDEWLKDYLLTRTKQDPKIQAELERVFRRYQADRLRRRGEQIDEPPTEGEEFVEEKPLNEDDDKGDNDNFFSWFFRGVGPPNVFSGASFNRNRLRSEGSIYSTFFEDNYITWLLGESDNPLQVIADRTNESIEQTVQRLYKTAFAIYSRTPRQPQRFPRLRIFLAYQEAALALLERTEDPELRDKARTIRRERFGGSPVVERSAPGNFPAPVNPLKAQTFFTELVKRRELREKLWPKEKKPGDFPAQFRRREQRRELLSTAARLGHPLIDLWLLARRLETTPADNQERAEDRAITLINDYLNLLEAQQAETGYNTFHELARIAENFDLILAVNSPGLTDESLPKLSTLFGQLLGSQTPVGGMWGGINQRLVRQFRMPGYPLILITTDVLQEGEDLHTFCANVIHYGISWTPSAMEQRTGRIDRIRSLTQRRLDNKHEVRPEEMLQVYYPHLQETVERLQVERVYERMNRFIRLLHHSFAGEQVKDSRINTNQEFVMRPRDIKHITERLETIFPVKKEWLRRDLPPKPIAAETEAQEILTHFEQVTKRLSDELQLILEPPHDKWSYFATVFIIDGQLVTANQQRLLSARQQPFALFLRTVTGDGRVLLRCVSPVGVVGQEDDESIERISSIQQELGFGKICAVRDAKLNTYNLTVEGDILFHARTTQLAEVVELINRTTHCADYMEKALLRQIDQRMEKFRGDLSKEPQRV